MTGPDFRSRAVLARHVARHARVLPPARHRPDGRLPPLLRDDGTIYDARTRHLVSSTRFVVNFALAWRHGGARALARRAAARRSLPARRPSRPRDGRLRLALRWDGRRATPLDATNHCYGLAFVLLAYAHASLAGVEGRARIVDETFDLMERQFWAPAPASTRTRRRPDWSARVAVPRAERQHARLRSDAGGVRCHGRGALSRARRKRWRGNITVRQAALADGLVWEHYHADWSVDWEYNRHDKHEYLPSVGLSARASGGMGEATADTRAPRSLPADWLAPRAARAVRRRRWSVRGTTSTAGSCTALRRTASLRRRQVFLGAGRIACGRGAAGARTGDKKYWEWYDRIWAYCWTQFVDHRYGAWYRILTRDNRKYSDEKSPAGKVDYHTMGACWDAMGVLP